MTTNASAIDLAVHRAVHVSRTHDYTRYLVPFGRLLFSLAFLLAASEHFSKGTIAFAAHHGVPFAGVLVPLAGLMLIVGGLSVLLGFRARIGALLLVLFLVPVTITMHDFWAVKEPMMHQMQQVMFLKNLSMLGGALLIMYFGAGPISLDGRFPSSSR